MRANVDEMFAEHLPNTSPDESYPCHVKICNFDKLLQTELARINSIIQLLARDATKILNELDDGILVEVKTTLENLFNLGHFDVLNDDFAVGLPVLLKHRFVCL